MVSWVYFEDHTAVRLADYRRDDELQKKPVAYVLDTASGRRTPGKPAAPRSTAKTDDKKD